MICPMFFVFFFTLLGESYGYEDDDSSSDSDHEMLLRYEHFVSTSNGVKGGPSGGLRVKSAASIMGGRGKYLSCFSFVSEEFFLLSEIR